MEGIISFLLIALIIWEFLTWRDFTKRRRLLVEFQKALLRYLYRRSVLVREITQYLERNQLSDMDVKQYELKFPDDDVSFAELQELILDNQKVDKAMHVLFREQKVQASVKEDKNFFYMVDEFSELQGVIGKCIEAYNQTYTILNKRLATPPTSFVAKFLRIKPVPTGLLKQ